MSAAGDASHYFDEEPVVRSRPSTVTLTLPDLTAELHTDRGMFSPDRIDPGTKLLLLEGPRPSSSAVHLVDLGCGYGPIAVTLARRAPGATVWAVDVNERALARCRENVASLGITNVVVARPDEVPTDVRVDELWSNPPVRIGKAALRQLLGDWLGRLTVGGRAYLVVQKHLGADTLARWLDEQGWSTRRLTSRVGYRVLLVSQ